MINVGTAAAVEPREPAALTSRQAEVLAFLRRYIAKHGYAPTLRETAQALGIASTNGVSDHLRSLARKGYIERAAGRARSIRPRPEAPQLASVPAPPDVVGVVTGRMRVDGAAAVACFDAGNHRACVTLVCAAFHGLSDGDVVSITFYRAASVGGQESQ